MTYKYHSIVDSPKYLDTINMIKKIKYNMFSCTDGHISLLKCTQSVAIYQHI